MASQHSHLRPHVDTGGETFAWDTKTQRHGEWLPPTLPARHFNQRLARPIAFGADFFHGSSWKGASAGLCSQLSLGYRKPSFPSTTWME